VVKADKMADKTEAALAAIRADLLLFRHRSLLRPEEVCSGAKILKSAAAVVSIN
jgi:hypothetical protein